jgi:hypothetical protein
MHIDKTKKRTLLIILLACTITTGLFSQTHLSILLEEQEYLFLEMAQIKGLVSNLTQVRPYSHSTVLRLLEEIDTKRHRLTQNERDVLDSELEKYRPKNREITAWNIIQNGKVFLNNEPEAIFPMAFGARFDFELRKDLNADSIHSTNMMELFMQGDVSKYLSYDIRVGVGMNDIRQDAFAPFSYTKVADGYYINTSGLGGEGLNDGNDKGGSFNILINPEIASGFFDDRITLKWHRHRRDMGNGDGNLTVSKTARPYDGIDLTLRPANWFNAYYSVGALGDWLNGSVGSANDNGNGIIDVNEPITQSMITTQLFELMFVDWLYLGVTNSVVWGKRFELSYMSPFLLPLLAQNLTGDHDNGSMEFSLAFKLPIGLKIYGNYFADEIRVSEDMFSDPAIQFAIQGGIRWVIPKLPFTMTSFQYTKIEPYTYTHYDQNYPFSDSSYYFDISWTNDGENLGYHLPPNSDEFLFKIQTMPFKNFSAFLMYQYIRHGDGNYEEGQMEGSTDSGGDGGEPAHAYNTTGTKDFLHDGIYEKIHIASIGASYKLDILPILFEADYSFVYADNYENIEGNSRIKNILGFKIHIFPEN